jgi:hypothetical protein
MVLGQSFQRANQQAKNSQPQSWRVTSRLKAARFRFTYTFESGYQLTGTVEGDYFRNAPNRVFNLRALKASCCNSQGQLLLTFGEVYGQFNLDFPGILFSGTNAATGSFFSFNYRSREADIYDATADTWVAIGWTPTHWSVTELAAPERLPQVRFSGQAPIFACASA